MSLQNADLIKGVRVKSLGGYSMIHNVIIKRGRLGIITKTSGHSFTVLLDGDTKGVSFPMCGKFIFNKVN